MKILLVDPPLEQFGDFSPFKSGQPFALGLLSVDSYLEKHGYIDIELEDYFRCDWGEVETRLRHSAPDVIGISCTTDSRGFCWRLSELAKMVNPAMKVVLGNVHASFFARKILEHYPVDFCVTFEGEQTMLELLRTLEARKTDYSRISGLAWRVPGTGQIRVNERRPFIRDLDAIPISPKRRIFVNEEGKRQANMMSSRGCPFACGFCSSAAFWRRNWRMHSPHRVVEEFEMLVGQGAEVIDICDDLFTLHLERAETISDLLIRGINKTPWEARARVDCITERLVDKMVAAGLRKISFGIESGDPEMIKRINKKIDLKQAVEVFEMLRKKKLIACANFMVGNLGETQESVEASIRLACRLAPTTININIVRVYPNTMLDVEAQKHGLIAPEFWYLDTAPVPCYTIDMSNDELRAHAMRMLFRWAVRRGPWAFARTVCDNWRGLGTRRSLSFGLSWSRRLLRGDS